MPWNVHLALRHAVGRTTFPDRADARSIRIVPPRNEHAIFSPRKSMKISIPLTLTLTLAVWLLSQAVTETRAAAQALPDWMKVSASYVSSAQMAVHAAGAAKLHPEQSARRGAFMVAAGFGAMAGGALIPSLINDRRCPDGAPLYKASVPGGIAVGVAGLALTAVGVFKLRKQRFADRQLRQGDAAKLILTSVGTAVVATGLLAAISASQIVGCIE
jgi:hypothetical protein